MSGGTASTRWRGPSRSRAPAKSCSSSPAPVPGPPRPLRNRGSPASSFLSLSIRTGIHGRRIGPQAAASPAAEAAKKLGNVLRPKQKTSGAEARSLFARLVAGLKSRPDALLPFPESFSAARKAPKNIPQGLKPAVLLTLCGTTEVVPFQNLNRFEFFRSGKGQVP